jgi:hypothetical protein
MIDRTEHGVERRWKATITYVDRSWVVCNFDEFDDLGDFIEAGPNWNIIEQIGITLNYRNPIGDFGEDKGAIGAHSADAVISLE